MSGALLETYRRLRPVLTPRWIRLTATGAAVFAACLGIGGMAIFFSNNLFYYLVSMLLGFVAISGVLSEMTIRGIELKRSVPDDAHALAPVLVTAEITNLKRRASSLCLQVIDETLGGEGFILEVPPGGRARQRYPVRFARRGLHAFGRASVTTTFPFGFFKKATVFQDDATFVVLPVVRNLEFEFRSRGLGSGEFRMAFRGEGTNLHSIREYRIGDSSRFIHWKSTARVMELMIKDLEREVTGKATLELAGGFGGRIETAVALAASLASEVNQRQIRVRVRMGATESSWDCGPRHLRAVLRMLALYEDAPLASSPPASKEEHVIRIAPPGAQAAGGREMLIVGPEWDWLLEPPQAEERAR